MTFARAAAAAEHKPICTSNKLQTNVVKASSAWIKVGVYFKDLLCGRGDLKWEYLKVYMFHRTSLINILSVSPGRVGGCRNDNTQHVQLCGVGVLHVQVAFKSYVCRFGVRLFGAFIWSEAWRSGRLGALVASLLFYVSDSTESDRFNTWSLAVNKDSFMLMMSENNCVYWHGVTAVFGLQPRGEKKTKLIIR